MNIYYQLFYLVVITYPSANLDAELGDLFVKDAPEVQPKQFPSRHISNDHFHTDCTLWWDLSNHADTCIFLKNATDKVHNKPKYV